MPVLTGRPMFSVAGTSYAWEDVVMAGCLWGDWPALEGRVRDGLCCLAREDELDTGALGEADVEAAAAEFRYARDLVAAVDLERWLDARGLTVDAWLDFLHRSLLRERWSDDLDEIREVYAPDEEDVAEAAVCEAVCSGLAADLVTRLAACAAIHARAADLGLALDETAAEPAGVEAAVARALPDVTPGVRHTRLAALARLEPAWRRFVAETAPPEALRALLGARRLDWVRLTIDSVVTADGDVARELALCAREDRRPLTEVAAEAGLGVRTSQVWLEEVEEAQRHVMVGAQPGDVLGPLTVKEGHLVLTVNAKALPREDDPAVRARAEQALLARAVEREIGRRVTWHATL